jgi:hypothetical protein
VGFKRQLAKVLRNQDPAALAGTTEQPQPGLQRLHGATRFTVNTALETSSRDGTIRIRIIIGDGKTPPTEMPKDLSLVKRCCREHSRSRNLKSNLFGKVRKIGLTDGIQIKRLDLCKLNQKPVLQRNGRTTNRDKDCQTRQVAACLKHCRSC